ncbi:hypothetical protein BA062_28180 [Prauserella flavalba]|uniref:Uncharacterized protein n=1 Tax=Prauserella flavalba TaxID=1477506 RepID=A0A318M224_9PSEU|nr:hypothetical protein BA062_28180 [Prauserella flavalba]
MSADTGPVAMRGGPARCGPTPEQVVRQHARVPARPMITRSWPFVPRRVTAAPAHVMKLAT